MAKFYGIGTGPGEPDLLTLRGKQIIQTIDCLYTPEPKKGGTSLALSIVQGFLPDTLSIKQRHFPMVKELEVKQQSWSMIANEIIADVKAGKNVGFITLGDPMIYSTYSYLLDLVKDTIDTETIAGISSFTQISNALQIPLVMDEESYAVLPATASAETIQTALQQFSTIVLMKVAVDLPKIIKLLAQERLLAKTVLMSNVSTAGESVTKDLSDWTGTEKIPYFSTMIVYKTKTII